MQTTNFGLIARVATCIGLFGAVCHAQTLVPLGEFEHSISPNTKVVFAPQGGLLAHSFADFRGVRRVEIRRTQVNGELLHTLGEEPSETRAVVFAPDGDTLAWVLGDKIGVLSNLHQEKTSGLSPAIAFSASVVAFSPDGTLLAAAADSIKDGQLLIRLFDVKTGTARGDLKAAPQLFSGEDKPTPLSALVFSPDGKRIVAANLASTLIWEISTSKLLNQKFHLESEQISLSPDGNSLGIIFSEPIGPSDGSEMHSRQLCLEFQGKSLDLTLKPGLGDFEFSGTPAFSLNNQFIAAPVWRSRSCNSLTIWRANDGKEVLRRPTQFEQKFVAFGPTK